MCGTTRWRMKEKSKNWWNPKIIEVTQANSEYKEKWYRRNDA